MTGQEWQCGLRWGYKGQEQCCPPSNQRGPHPFTAALSVVSVT